MADENWFVDGYTGSVGRRRIDRLPDELINYGILNDDRGSPDKILLLLKEIGHCYFVLTLIPLTGQHLLLCYRLLISTNLSVPFFRRLQFHCLLVLYLSCKNKEKFHIVHEYQTSQYRDKMDQLCGETKHFIEHPTDPNKDIVEYRLDKKTGHFVKEEFEVEDVYEEYPAVSSESLNLSCTQSQSRWESWERKQDGKKFSKQIFCDGHCFDNLEPQISQHC